MRLRGFAIAVVLLACAFDAARAADEPALKGKKVLMVVAPVNFRDEELKTPRDLLEKKGVEVALASTTLDEIKGMLGMKVIPSLLLKDAKAADFDAVVFVGGSGAKALFDNADAWRLAREMNKFGKLVGAICLGPCIPAKAGILKGRRATVYPKEEYTDILRENGATVVPKEVVEDGLIVTANGPNASARFGDALVRALALPFKDDPPP